MATRVCAGIVLFIWMMTLAALPLAAQNNQYVTPYYDPRYEDLSKPAAGETSGAAQTTANEIRELPATAGHLPALSLLGVLSVLASAGLGFAQRPKG